MKTLKFSVLSLTLITLFTGSVLAGNDPPPMPTGQVTTTVGGNPPNCPPLSNGHVFNSVTSDIGKLFGSGPDAVIQSSNQRQEHIFTMANHNGQVQEWITQESQRVDALRSCNLTPELSQQTRDLENKPVDQLVQGKAKPKGTIDVSQIPNPDESSLPYQFQSPVGAFRDEMVQLYKDLYKVQPQFGKQQKTRELGLIATEEADRSYSLGNANDANFYKELGKEFLDITVGLDPVTGFGRSAYELFYGRNLITGMKLNSVERSFAFLGVATAGGSRFLHQAGRGMWRIYQRASHLLQERQAIESAIREGEVLIGRAGHLLNSWKKNHQIISITSAIEANAPHISRGHNPPYQHESFVVHFKTIRESHWVRVHTDGNQPGNWVLRASEIRGLTPAQIAEKFALPQIPMYVSDVYLPSNTLMSRGNVQAHPFGRAIEGRSGSIQYRIEQTMNPEEFVGLFSNPRPLPEVF